MARAIFCLLVALLFASGATAQADDATTRTIDELTALHDPAATKGQLIERMSREFLGTPYGADMLIGSATRPEQLVVDFSRLDCFTYLDYTEAATRSASRDDFVANLIATRYVDGVVDFAHRRHFFTDWAYRNPIAAVDITGSLSPAAATVGKHLNAKADGGSYLPGLPVVSRAITYIPSAAVDGDVVAGLRTGDYIGAYADAAGLDVTHTGIFVATPVGPMFRNASSLAANNRVVDSPFLDYVRTVPGIVVLRAN